MIIAIWVLREQSKLWQGLKKNSLSCRSWQLVGTTALIKNQLLLTGSRAGASLWCVKLSYLLKLSERYS